MLSQRLTAATPTTLELLIAHLYQNEKKEIEELFLVDPDGMFAQASIENAFAHVAKIQDEETKRLLGRLSFQFIEDKIKQQAWDKAATFFLGIARYYLFKSDFNNARSYFEKAWFYQHKHFVATGDARALGLIEREFVDCCDTYYVKADNAKKLNQIHWTAEYDIIYTLEQTIFVLRQIAMRTGKIDDANLVKVYRSYLSRAHKSLATSLTMLSATSQPELAGERIRFARYHEFLAKKLNPNKADVTLDEDLLAQKNKLISLLAFMAEKRNADADEIREFVLANQININQSQDTLNVLGIANDQRCVPLSNAVVSSGNLLVLKLFIEELNATTWLFPTIKRKGLLEDISHITNPAVIEYLATPNAKFYQVPEQKEIVELFQDALAGRLASIKEKLTVNPDLILAYPIYLAEDDKSIPITLLHVAAQAKQSQVTHYLEIFIFNYVKNNTLDMASLERFHEAVLAGVITTGWCETRIALAQELQPQTKASLTQALKDLELKPVSEHTEEDAINLILYRFKLLMITFSEGEIAERLGDTPDADKLTMYITAKGCYQDVIDNILILDSTKLPKEYAFVCSALFAKNEELDKKLKKIEDEILGQEEKDDEIVSEEKEEKKTPAGNVRNYSTPSGVNSWPTHFHSSSSSSASTPTTDLSDLLYNPKP